MRMIPGIEEKLGREREREVWMSLTTLFFFSFPSFLLGAPLISWVFVGARVVEELRGSFEVKACKEVVGLSIGYKVNTL